MAGVTSPLWTENGALGLPWAYVVVRCPLSLDAIVSTGYLSVVVKKDDKN